MDSHELDRAMDVLSNVHRRQLLLELREMNPHGEHPEVTRGSIGREQLAVQMVHTHLPKLEEAGFVEWNREAGTVVKGDRFGELVPLLDALSE